MREFARKKIGKGCFYEIYIKADLETCVKRDPKGLYKKAKDEEISDFTGISSPYEEPENPELVIDTTKLAIKESVNIILKMIKIY